MADTAKSFGCAQGDAPQGASSEGETKGLGGGVKKPAKPKKAKTGGGDEDE